MSHVAYHRLNVKHLALSVPVWHLRSIHINSPHRFHILTWRDNHTNSLRSEWTPHILLRLAAAALNVFISGGRRQKRRTSIAVIDENNTEMSLSLNQTVWSVCDGCVNMRNTVDSSSHLRRLDAETPSLAARWKCVLVTSYTHAQYRSLVISCMRWSSVTFMLNIVLRWCSNLCSSTVK